MKLLKSLIKNASNLESTMNIIDEIWSSIKKKYPFKKIEKKQKKKSKSDKSDITLNSQNNLTSLDNCDKKYNNSIKEKLKEISEDDFTNPNLSILYSALYESYPYIQEKEIRELFANLVASSFDKRKTEYLHPGFIGVIKQLSPNDARILQFINDSEKIQGIAAVKNKKEIKLLEGLSLEKFGVEQISLSLDNLSRLGLIQINRYNGITYIGEGPGYYTIDHGDPVPETADIYKKLHEEYDLYYVNTFLTVFGESFIKVCTSDS